MGAKIVLAGPATMLPRNIEQMGVAVHTKLEDAIVDADVVMMLRIQLERQNQSIFPSLREYSQHYCLNRNNIKLAKKDVIVMHPGPMNRGVEISPDIADDPSCSVILDQVNNGVAVRMALLYLLTGGNE
jgi:aspartate carbamoyltransferase catalytic subunit